MVLTPMATSGLFLTLASLTYSMATHLVSCWNVRYISFCDLSSLSLMGMWLWFGEDIIACLLKER